MILCGDCARFAFGIMTVICLDFASVICLDFASVICLDFCECDLFGFLRV